MTSAIIDIGTDLASSNLSSSALQRPLFTQAEAWASDDADDITLFIGEIGGGTPHRQFRQNRQ